MARTQVPRSMLGSDARKVLLVFPVYTPAAASYNMLLNAPFDMDIETINYQCDTGTLTFSIDIEGTDVTWTTDGDTNLGASSSAAEDTPSAGGTISAGDAITIEVDSIDTGTPGVLKVELWCTIAEEDA